MSLKKLVPFGCPNFHFGTLNAVLVENRKSDISQFPSLNFQIPHTIIKIRNQQVAGSNPAIGSKKNIKTGLLKTLFFTPLKLSIYISGKSDYIDLSQIIRITSIFHVAAK